MPHHIRITSSIGAPVSVPEEVLQDLIGVEFTADGFCLDGGFIIAGNKFISALKIFDRHVALNYFGPSLMPQSAKTIMACRCEVL